VEGPILKRIPRAARMKAAVVFEATLRKVIERPDDIDAWCRILEFALCLRQPPQGGA